VVTPKFILPFVLVIAFLTACAAPAPTEPPAPERVEITLTEFAIESSLTEFKAGQPYEFVITNDGAIAHELRIIPPVHGEEDVHSGESHHSSLFVVTEDDLPAGESVTVSYTFDADQSGRDLEFACHIEGHYEAEMRLPITVEE
jgi:uncharacterized cupredoxin-like copper-binding protein